MNEKRQKAGGILAGYDVALKEQDRRDVLHKLVAKYGSKKVATALDKASLEPDLELTIKERLAGDADYAEGLA
jgi:hypothetical protein